MLLEKQARDFQLHNRKPHSDSRSREFITGTQGEKRSLICIHVLLRNPFRLNTLGEPLLTAYKVFAMISCSSEHP